MHDEPASPPPQSLELGLHFALRDPDLLREFSG